jgi:membrane protease subunit HflC
MKIRIIAIAAIVIGILAAIVLFSGLYTVSEMEYAVITQFGEPVRTVNEAGLHWKTPFIQQAHRIERRILAWDGDPNDVITQDKKNIFIDTWARWRVVEPRQFYVSLGGRIVNGQKKLDDIVDGEVRNAIARYSLNELVRSSDRELKYEEDLEGMGLGLQTGAEAGSGKRLQIEQEMLAQASKDLEKNFGMELMDVRIKRVNYISAVRNSIYGRMRSERSRISSRFVSEAKEQENIILGDMSKELAAIEGEGAQRTAEITGEADALAIQIYADAIKQARELYEFVRTLEAYEKTFDQRTLLILSTDSRFLRLLKEDMGLKEGNP